MSITLPGVAFDKSSGGLFFSFYVKPVLFPLALAEGMLTNETSDRVDSSVLGATISTEGRKAITDLTEPVTIYLASFRIMEYPSSTGVQVSN